ncbi:MAG: acyltransferase [Micavibrio sp.]|nr:acyltransferase [Micavibrio sp.]
MLKLPSLFEQSSHDYRPDIDGLRALAVLAVVFFHLDFSYFPGGFVGVDVFFVISGFLITRLILFQVQNDIFSFKDFYIRRVRRLMPALFFTLAFCMICGAFILSPQHFERMNGAMVYALFSVSNFFFLGEMGYFDVGAKFKPLLHTWSLAIEEQFYLLWPATLVFMLFLKQRLLIYILSIAAIVFSLGLAVLLQDSESSYYFTPLRVYEFFIGISVCFLPRFGGSNTAKEALFLSGMVMILSAILIFDRFIPFPSFYAAIPCLGAAMVIYADNPRYSGALLRNRAFVYIGLISYSLYLIHWPLYVFFYYFSFGSWSFLGIVVLALSLGMAALMHRYIEQPFRKRNGRWPDRNFRFVMPFVFLALLAAALHAWKSGGWNWRFSNPLSAGVSQFIEDTMARKDAYREEYNVYRNGMDTDTRPNILIVGDSHSQDLFIALHQNKELIGDVDILQMPLDEKCFERPNYRPSLSRRILGLGEDKISDSCADVRKDIENSPFAAKADMVIIATAAILEDLDRFGNYADFMRSIVPECAKLAMFGYNWIPFDPQTIYLIRSGDADTINRQLYSLDRVKDIRSNRALAEAANNAGLSYFDYYPLLCSDTEKQCLMVGEDNTLLYHDDNHWSFEGAALFGRSIISKGLISTTLKACGDP